MRWENDRRSDNIEDRRGEGGLGGGGGFGFPGMGGGGIRIGGGIGGVLVVLALLYFGIDPSMLFGDGGGPGSSDRPYSAPQTPAPGPNTADSRAPGGRADRMKDFVSVVLADTEDVWRAQFKAMGRQYVEPHLVLFSGGIRSGCGDASSAVGPFYCPVDQKVYIDLTFYDELQRRFGAPGDFAQAYVIAHEVGHHVQRLLGVTDKVEQMRGRMNASQANALSVRVELQADCYAGIWAHDADRAKQVVEPGDIDEALNAAAAIGDDRLQRQSRGGVNPESFTHGTSQQRVRWFKRGYDSGQLNQCDTFNAAQL
jgi:predicted metalloprotease